MHEARSGSGHDGAGAARSSVEIRSVNGRFLDLALRLPDELRGLEPALREMLTARFKRGKVELRVSTPAGAEQELPEPSALLLARLARIESSVREHLPEARPLSVQEAMQWCRGAGAAGGSASAAPDAEADVLHVARRAVEGLVEARAREGARLAAVLLERVGHLRSLALAAEPLVPAAVARQQQRFAERWADALAQAKGAETLSRAAVEERALSEAAAYAIRIDVAEELARLRSHLDEIERLLGRGGEVGKRLEFLIQELLREANTLGSKSAQVEMKVAIEQMREQVQNVE